MDEIMQSEQHKRNGDGQVILDYQSPKKDKFWIAAISFICVFSVTLMALAIMMFSRSALAAKLDDMTELYNYQLNVPEEEPIYIVYGRLL